MRDLLLAGRIPVTGRYPDRDYLAALYIPEDAPEGVPPGIDETDLGVIASYIAYLRSKYPPRVQLRMQEDLYDIGDRATIMLVKLGHQEWSYRRAHWTGGPFWAAIEGGGTLTLPGLLDYIETSHGAAPAPAWQAWKAGRRCIFPGSG